MITGRTVPTIANATRRALPRGSNELDPIHVTNRPFVEKLESNWISLPTFPAERQYFGALGPSRRRPGAQPPGADRTRPPPGEISPREHEPSRGLLRRGDRRDRK